MQERRTAGEVALERRRSRRPPLRVDIDCNVAGTCFSGTTKNLSIGGFFLETDTPVSLDAELELLLELPGQDEPLKAFGRVVRLAQRGGDTPGFAVKFLNLGDAACARIEALVKETLADMASPNA